MIGQAINVSVGAAGFVLIMAGRTGWDLIVYSLSATLDLTLAFLLVPKFGIDGAAAAQAITIACLELAPAGPGAPVRRDLPVGRRLRTPRDPVGALRDRDGRRPSRRSTRRPGTNAWSWSAFIGVVVYVPALLAFALTPEERTALRNGVAKLRGR